MLSDSAEPAMNPARKDKLCLVCSDKALGYNFGAISCESCKSFFRRNAHKVIRGRCEGKCEVSVESRSFCKRCRLAKCVLIGMKREMILNDEQKKQRNQKIIINKLRRHGQLPPEDRYSASSIDLIIPDIDTAVKVPGQLIDTTSSLLVIKQESVESNSSMRSVTSPTWSCGAGFCLPVTSPIHSPRKLSSSSEFVHSYTPWKDRQNQVQSVIKMMPIEKQLLINELLAAMEFGSFFVMSSSSLKMLPSNPEEFINMAELFVRKFIKVAKNVSFFKQLHKDDQISLLKGSVVDIMMLRSAVNFDPFTESWSLNTKDCINQGSSQATGERISAEILKSGSNETRHLFMTYNKFIKSLMHTIHGDLVALKLLILVSLFSADRMPMVDHTRVQEIQEMYAHILEEYISLSFNQESTLFARVLMKLADLRNINEVHSKMLLRMKVDEFEPLLVEIFDLPEEVGFVPTKEITNVHSLPTSLTTVHSLPTSLTTVHSLPTSLEAVL